MTFYEDIPKPFRAVILIVIFVFAVASAAVAAYAGATAKASDVAATISSARDAVIQKDLDDHKQHDNDRFNDLKDSLRETRREINAKLDKLLERSK